MDLSSLRRETIPKPDNEDEWLALRRPYFNASAAAILWDRHDFLTPGDYATQKLAGGEQRKTGAMLRGHRFEDLAATWFEDKYDLTAWEAKDLYVAGRIMATPDRIVCPSGFAPWDDVDRSGNRPLEIKTTNDRERDPKQYWLDQCQAQALCFGSDRVELVWLDGWLDLHHKTVYADEAHQSDLVTRAEEFMASIDMGIAPDWVTFSYDNLAALHPESHAGAVELDDETFNLLRHYHTSRTVRLEAEKDEEHYKAKVCGVLRDCEAGVYRGETVVTWKKAKDSSQHDAERFVEEQPQLAARYRKPKPGGRRFLSKLDSFGGIA